MSNRSLATVYGLVGVVVFLVTAIACAPASLIKYGLKNQPAAFSYKTIEGSLWSGVIRNVTVGQADLGDIRFKTNGWSLLTGRLDAALSFNGQDLLGTSRVEGRLGGEVALHDTNLQVNLTNISRRYAFMGAPIEGDATVTLKTMVYGKRGCRSAEGDIWTNILQGPARAFNGQSFDLAGPVQCNDKILTVSLEGAGEEGSVTLLIAIRPDLTYSLTADAVVTRREVDQALRLIGFEQGPEGLTYDASGVFKGV